MATATSPTTQTPKHHVTLSDGTDTLGFVLVDGSGQPNHRAIQRNSVTRQAIKTYSGNGKWDDFEPPYITAAQDDWAGGRGGEIFEDDTSRYSDGYGVQFDGGKMTLGPMVTFASGHRSQDQSMPYLTMTMMDWADLYSSTRYMSQSFVASASYTAKAGQAWVKYHGTGVPGTLTFALYSNNAGVPNALLASGTVGGLVIDDSVSKLVVFDLGAGTALTSGTTYHVVIYGPSTATSTEYWSLGCNGTPNAGSNQSSNGASWTAAENAPLYRVLDDVSRFSGRGIFFNYKGAEYLVTQPDDVTLKSFLYMNGDRGAADANTGALGRLVDNSKAASAWTNDEWNDCVVRIIAGPGSNEAKPWRTITDTVVSGGSAYLVVDEDWKIEHTTATEYVIVKSDVWQNKFDLGYYCTDVAVAGENVYFAFGDYSTSNVIKRYREYNNGGTWTEVTPANDVVKAQSLCAIRHPELDTMVLYGSQHHHALYGTCLWRGLVPLAWGDLYSDLGALAGTAKPWDGDTTLTNVTQGTASGDTTITIAAGFGTGVVAEEDLTSTDVSAAKKIAVLAKSSVVTAAADVDWQLYDGANTMSIDVPAITVADTWTWLVSSFSPADTGSAVYSSIDAVRLALATDLGAQVITLHGGVRLLSDDLEYIDFPNNSRINKIVPYGGSQTEPRRNPWVLTEGMWYEVQTQNSDAVVPIPLDEMETIKDYRTGKASGVNDVYLYSNMGLKFERYFGRNLDDIGPDLDGGLPSSCTGELVDVLSLPGTLMLVIDGVDNFSNIMMLRGSSWHTFYRSPHQIGAWQNRIRSVGVQSIPGLDHIWIWAIMGDSIVRLPYGFSPYKDDTYPMTHEGVIETPWITGNLMTVTKLWKSLSVFGTFGVDTAQPYVLADYKTSEVAYWTAITGQYGESTEELDIAATPVSSRKIKFRFRIWGQSTNTYQYKPLIDAWVLDYYAFAGNKRSYTFTAMLADEDEQGGGVNLDMERERALGYTERAETAQAKLDAWSDAATPLTMRSLYSVMDNKTVVLQDIPLQPLDLNWRGQVEKHLLQITVNEL